MLKGISAILAATIALTAEAIDADTVETVADKTEAVKAEELKVAPSLTRQECLDYVEEQMMYLVNDRKCEKGNARDKLGHDVFGRAIFHVQDCPMCQAGYKFRGLQEWMQYI